MPENNLLENYLSECDNNKSIDSLACILYCIIYYNNHRIIDFPFTEAMIAAEVKPYASSIFHWGRKQMGANLMDVDAKKLIQVLLPRATGKFTRKGLVVNGLRYRHDDYTEAFLRGGEAVVAYNPEDVTEVWLIENTFSNHKLAVAQYANTNRPGGKFCVSDIRQNQEYHIINVHDVGLFTLATAFSGGWDGMRAGTA